MAVNGLAGHVVVVTGASSGLGVQLGQALASAGATPVLAARRADRLEALISAIPGADAVTCDVTDEADRRRLVETVLERHGRLDGLDQQRGRRRNRAGIADLDRGLREGDRPQPHGPVRALLPRRAAHAQRRRTLDRQHRVGPGPSVDRRDPRRSVRRVEGRHHRPDARARLAVGAIRDPRQRRRPGLLRHRDERRARRRPRGRSPTSSCRAPRSTVEDAPASSTRPSCSSWAAGSSYVTGHVLSVDGGMSAR